MANEMVHGSVGTAMTQAEFEAVGLHVCNSQTAGDLIYASSSTQLSRLAIGATNTVLHVAGGIPAWSATLAGITLTAPTLNGITTLGSTLVFDAGAANMLMTTTGQLTGIRASGSHADNGPGVNVYHEHTTPVVGSVLGGLEFYGYDGQVTPVIMKYGSVRVLYTNVTDTTEASEFRWNLATAGADNIAMSLSGAGVLTLDHTLLLNQSVDSAAVADQVRIGGYEIGVGNRVLAISQETAVAADTVSTKFSNKVQCRINGATYFIMLTVT